MTHDALTQHIAAALQPWLNDERVVDAIIRYVATFNPREAAILRRAERDWLKRYARAWLDFHLPDWVVYPNTTQPPIKQKNPKLIRRRAKSYLSHRTRV